MNKSDDLFSRSSLVWGEEKQQRLAAACLLIAGVGGLGCIVAELLVRNGLKKIVLIDHGKVDTPDLNRQILYTRHDLGKWKVDVAQAKLTAIHDFTEVIPVNLELREAQDLLALIAQHRVEMIADCLDNYPSRFVLEKALAPGMFLIHGGVQADYGQVLTICRDRSVTLAKLYKNAEDLQTPIPVCAQAVACIGSIMVQEILNTLWGKPQLLNQLQIMEFNDFSFSRIQLG